MVNIGTIGNYIILETSEIFAKSKDIDKLLDTVTNDMRIYVSGGKVYEERDRKVGRLIVVSHFSFGKTAIRRLQRERGFSMHTSIDRSTPAMNQNMDCDDAGSVTILKAANRHISRHAPFAPVKPVYEYRQRPSLIHTIPRMNCGFDPVKAALPIKHKSASFAHSNFDTRNTHSPDPNQARPLSNSVTRYISCHPSYG